MRRSDHKVAALLNIPFVEARKKINKLTDRFMNADTIYKLVKDATDDEDLACEVMTSWVTSRSNMGKNPKEAVNLDSLGLSGAIADLFNKGESNGQR